MQLSDVEAKAYAEAIAAVARHYDIGASAKALDWTNLLTTMGSIYGVRVMAITMRRKTGASAAEGAGLNGNAAPSGEGAAQGEAFGMVPQGRA